MPGKISVNYRRTDADTWASAESVYERLATQLPRGGAFMDIDGNIPLGHLEPRGSTARWRNVT